MKVTTIKIQDNKAGFLRARLSELGLDEGILSTDRILLSDGVVSKVSDKIEEALAPLLDKIELALMDGAGKTPEAAAAVADALRNNIQSFKLDAGAGFTTAHKEALSKAHDGITMETFVPPARGGSTAPKADDQSIDLEF